MITARSQYDERVSMASDLSFEGDKGVTKIADAKDCDINLLFKRFEKTGQLPDMIVRNGRYGDFSAVPDYQEACQIVKLAEEQFLALDAHIRNRFENDPAKFLEFATNPANVEEMLTLGLLNDEAKAKYQAEKTAKANAEQVKIDALRAAEKAKLLAEIKAELNK